MFDEFLNVLNENYAKLFQKHPVSMTSAGVAKVPEWREHQNFYRQKFPDLTMPFWELCELPNGVCSIVPPNKFGIILLVDSHLEI